MTIQRDNEPRNDNSAKHAYRAREYNRSGSTSYSFSNDLNELHDRLDDGVNAGCLTGGDCDAWIDDIGWIVVDNADLDDDNADWDACLEEFVEFGSDVPF